MPSTRENLTKNSLIKLVAADCDYHEYEVDDVLTSFMDILRQELENGNQIQFTGLFRMYLEKPKPKWMFNPGVDACEMSPGNVRLRFHPSKRYKDGLKVHKGAVFVDRTEDT